MRHTCHARHAQCVAWPPLRDRNWIGAYSVIGPRLTLISRSWPVFASADKAISLCPLSPERAESSLLLRACRRRSRAAAASCELWSPNAHRPAPPRHVADHSIGASCTGRPALAHRLAFPIAFTVQPSSILPLERVKGSAFAALLPQKRPSICCTAPLLSPPMESALAAAHEGRYMPIALAAPTRSFALG